MQSFKFLRYALHGDLVEDRRRERERREEEKIMPILMATSPSAQRRSDQNYTKMHILHKKSKISIVDAKHFLLNSER